jgi:predicted CXXCH cytochrome family protein
LRYRPSFFAEFFVSVTGKIFMRPHRSIRYLCVAAVFFFSAAVLVRAQNPGSSSDPPAGKYVGVEVCQGCHEDSYKTFAESKHMQTLKRPKVSEQGCEGCHGPGADHAEAGDPDKIRRFPTASPVAIREACTVCHQANLGAAHQKAGLTCLTCHSAHHYLQRESILVAPQLQLCRRCHKF